jgi:hypothetical protein
VIIAAFRSQKKNIYIVLGLFLVAFLFLNVFFSQYISPLFLAVADDEKRGTVEFLEKIKATDEFADFFQTAKSRFGSMIEEEVFEEDRKRALIITELEQILLKTPEARDVLFNLHALYQREGEENRSQEYLKRATEIDPSIEQ